MRTDGVSKVEIEKVGERWLQNEASERRPRQEARCKMQDAGKGRRASQMQKLLGKCEVACVGRPFLIWDVRKRKGCRKVKGKKAGTANGDYQGGQTRRAVGREDLCGCDSSAGQRKFRTGPWARRGTRWRGRALHKQCKIGLLARPFGCR